MFKFISKTALEGILSVTRSGIDPGFSMSSMYSNSLIVWTSLSLVRATAHSANKDLLNYDSKTFSLVKHLDDDGKSQSEKSQGGRSQGERSQLRRSQGGRSQRERIQEGRS